MSEIRFVPNVPNKLTFARMVLAVPIVLAFHYGFHAVAFGLFAIACVTDLLDGFLARRLRCQSPWGHVGDPIADKLICFAALAALFPTYGQRPWFIIPVTLVCVYDVFVMYLRKHVAYMPTNNWAKVKTAFLMVGLTSGFVAIIIDDALSASPSIPLVFYEAYALGCIATTLCCAAACAVCSAIAYFSSYLGTASAQLHPAE